MNLNPGGWFEIPVLDIERATRFYETLLGLELNRQDVPGYEMVWFPVDREKKGIGGALMKGDGYHPGRGTVIYFNCESIDAVLVRAGELGAEVMLPKKDIGEWGYIAWVHDTEGNVVGLHMMK
jgi:predicted enzyme related to lactoylglutathione lyase